MEKKSNSCDINASLHYITNELYVFSNKWINVYINIFALDSPLNFKHIYYVSSALWLFLPSNSPRVITSKF